MIWVAKGGSSPSVSCLNFEPKVSKFPVLEACVASSTNATASSPFRRTYVYEKAFEWWNLTWVAKGGSSPSVSLLNFEPKVSKFPVLEACVASSTNATASSPFRWTCVYERAFKWWDFPEVARTPAALQANLMVNSATASSLFCFVVRNCNIIV